MSVQAYKTADGVQWRVRWREPDGKMRSRTVLNKRAALALDVEVRARKYKGEVMPRPGRETLATAYEEWKELRAPLLSQNTLDTERIRLNMRRHATKDKTGARSLADACLVC